MNLGVYTSCMHEVEFADMLNIVADLGLSSIEVNAGGFLASPHLPVAALMATEKARREYLATIRGAGLVLTALNVNGNPLHPDIEVSSRHAEDLRTAIHLAALLGIRNVVTMSGQPGSDPGGTAPAWIVEPWNSAATEVLDYQWDSVALPFWRTIDHMARDLGVQICIEMHPHNLVYNPATLVRLIERLGTNRIGAEMDPSHLFWQGIEPITAIQYLGDRVFHAAAKDVRMNPHSVHLNGILDDRFRPPAPGEPATRLGGRYVLNNFPEDPPWQFVAIGRGHDIEYWARFLDALRTVNPDIAINIEHEDSELAGRAGLVHSAEALHAAAAALTRDI